MAENDLMGCDHCGTHVESGAGHYVPLVGGGDELRVCADCADRVSVWRERAATWERYAATWQGIYGERASVTWSLPPMGDSGERGEKWRRALPLVAAYAEAFDAGEPIETVLTDMIADMLHLLDFQGGNEHAGDAEPWDAVGAARDLLDKAVGHWVQERGGVWA